MIDQLYNSYWLVCLANEQAAFAATGYCPPIWLTWRGIPICLGLLTCVLMGWIQQTSNQSNDRQ